MKRRALLLTAIAMSVIVVSPVEPARAVVLEGGPGDDAVFGGPGADVLRGRGGNNNYLFGKKNPRPRTVNGRRVVPVDKLIGEGGIDFADGGSGRDVVSLANFGFAFDDDGTGSDRLTATTVFGADGARDVVKCPASGGLAFVDRVDKVYGCTVVVRQSAGHIAAALGAVIYVPFMGTADNDILIGDNQSADGAGGPQPVVFGGGGNDAITLVDDGYALGGAGADSLQGSAWADTLVDGDGTPGDTLSGGGGADRFFAADGAADTIDCGLNDAATDLVFADPEDTLINCVGETERRATNAVLPV